jgi:hypothetical protein
MNGFHHKRLILNVIFDLSASFCSDWNEVKWIRDHTMPDDTGIGCKEGFVEVKWVGDDVLRGAVVLRDIWQVF